MATSDFSIVKLKAELDADSETLGYGSWKTDDAAMRAAQDLINDPTKGGTARRNALSATEFFNAIQSDEWKALDDGERQYVSMLLRERNVDLEPDTVYQNLANRIFTAPRCPATRTALVSALSYDASRAEVLWGERFTVTLDQIQQAAGLPD